MDKKDVPVPEVFRYMTAALGKTLEEVRAIYHNTAISGSFSGPFTIHGKRSYFYVSGYLLGCEFGKDKLCESVSYGVPTIGDLIPIVLHILVNLRCRLADYILIPEVGKFSIWQDGLSPVSIRIIENLSADKYTTIQIYAPK